MLDRIGQVGEKVYIYPESAYTDIISGELGIIINYTYLSSNNIANMLYPYIVKSLLGVVHIYGPHELEFYIESGEGLGYLYNLERNIEIG